MVGPARSRLLRVFARLLLLMLLPALAGLAPAQTFTDSNFSLQKYLTVPKYQVISWVWAPDGRIFLAYKTGQITIAKNGAILATPFLDITSRVNHGGDRGLMGFALDPNFETNGYFYVSYVYEPNASQNGQLGPRTQRVSRFQVDPANPDHALASSEKVILGSDTDPNCNPSGIDCMPNEKQEHAIQKVAFGPDGKLWVLVGEGGISTSVDQNAFRVQDIDTLLGKLLRVNPDGTGLPDNPFYNGDPNANRSKVWMTGLRTPFTMTFNPANGQPYVGNVGWYSWEEINTGKGSNSGWPCYEGGLDANGNPVIMKTPQYWQDFPSQCGAIPASATTPPFWAYPHPPSPDNGACILISPFYTGSTYPAEYQGNLFIADYNSKWIKRLVFDANGNVSAVKDFATGINAPVAIEQGPDGNLYISAFLDNAIYKLVYNGSGNQPPVVKAAATPQYGPSPLTVSFSSAGSSDPEGGALSFTWNFGDGTTSTDPNPQHVYSSPTPKTYTVTLTAKDPSGLSGSNTVNVTVGDTPPVPTIQAPPNNENVPVGSTVQFSGSATDAEDGPLPPSSLHWQVILHHNDHVHYITDLSGSGGSFIVEDHAEIGAFYYEVDLTATDSFGVTATTSVRINPVAAAPPGTPDFAATANPTSITLKAGASASSTLTLTPSSGFTGTVNLACATPQGAPLSCSVSPASLNLNGAPGTAVLTVQAQTTTTAALPRRRRGLPPLTWGFPVVGIVAGSLWSSKKRKRTILAAAALVLCLLLLNSCQGLVTNGSGDATVPSTQTQGTPYTLQVNATSGNLTHQIQVKSIVE